MSRFYFRKLIYDNVETILMFEHGEIQKPIAILFPGDLDNLMECIKGKQEVKE